jgi:hypothetical protein
MQALLKLSRLLIASCVLFCWAVVCLAADREAAKTVSIHQVPAAVKKTIEDQASGFKLMTIEREESDSEVTYTATINKDGHDRDLSVAEDGRLISLEIGLKEAPAVVQNAIIAQVGQGELTSLEENLEEDAVSYDAEFTKKDGTESSFSINSEGQLTSLELTLEEVPAAVRKTIEANLGKGKLSALYRLIEKGETSYDAEVAFDEKERDIIVSVSGKLESVQVFLTELPPAVQNTIQEKMGAGKLIRIDRSYEARMGVLPYEVEARKDGKAFNFSVGPRGRFLGMD